MAQIKSPLGNKSTHGKRLKTFDVHSAEEEGNINNPEQLSEYDGPIVNPIIREKMNKEQNYNENKFNKDLEAIKSAEEAAERRRRAVRGQERLSKGALDRISLLLGMTQNKRTIQLGDVVFELRSLKSSESREVLKDASNAARIEYPFEIRRQYLARSIISVSGVDIDNFIGSSSLEDKLLFVDELDDAIASRLYSEYIELKKETDSRYAIKSDQEAKEIVENLKKS